jgi:thiol-disulfide isomerase/thioredoxin
MFRRFSKQNLFSKFLVASLCAASLNGFSPITSQVYSQDDKKAAEATEAADDELTPAKIMPMMRAGKADEVMQKLDAMLADAPLDSKLLSMELQVASMMMSTKPAVGSERMARLVDKLQAVEDPDASVVNMYVSAILNYSGFIGRTKPEDGLKMIGDAESKIAGKKSPAESNLAMAKARLLVQLERMDEARDALEASYVATRERAAEERYLVNNLVNIAINYDQMLGDKFADDAKAKMTDVEDLVREKLQGESVDQADVQALLSLKMSASSKLMYSDPTASKEVLEQLKDDLTKIEEKLPENQQMAVTRNLAMIDQRIEMVESSIRREQLIGTAAPELDAESFVGMDATTLRDLKGKVVLIDFWAVWCGPCIATFPHLQHLHDTYSDKGLVILGLTKPYSYKWNEEIKRAEKVEGVTAEEELEMLKTFREHHKLKHGFVVTPKDSKYSKAFEVTGIPQAALIDKDGIIRLIKVGSGDANSKAIEEMIKTLLDL